MNEFIFDKLNQYIESQYMMQSHRGHLGRANYLHYEGEKRIIRLLIDTNK